VKTRAAFLVAALAALLLFFSHSASSEQKTLRPFDGQTLKGWDGNPKFWSVKDGCITGQTTADNPTQGNTFLIWRDGTVKDFELSVKYRIVGGNSGIQYRSKEIDKWVIGGYQADFEAGDTWNGILCPPGEKSKVGADGKPVKVGAVSTKEDILKAIKKEQWNEYSVRAKGNEMRHAINGVVTAEVVDEDEAHRVFEGLLALQLHAGPPMLVQFKDLKLTPL
jgi:hypothetical protein